MERCINCGNTENIHHHHVVPLVLGGSDIKSNIVPLCGICHGIVHDSKSLSKKNLVMVGIRRAQAEGKYRGRKQIDVDPEYFKEIYWDWKAGDVTAKHAAELLKLKPNTFYRRVKEFEAYGSL